MLGANSIDQILTLAAPSQRVSSLAPKPVKPSPVSIDAPCAADIRWIVDV